MRGAECTAQGDKDAAGGGRGGRVAVGVEEGREMADGQVGTAKITRELLEAAAAFWG